MASSNHLSSFRDKPKWLICTVNYISYKRKKSQINFIWACLPYSFIKLIVKNSENWYLD